MSPVSIGSGIGEQAPITVNMLLKNPLMVPELMRNLFRGQFIADLILRSAGEASGGAVQYWVSGPVFPDVGAGDAEAVAPLAEIPVVNPLVGTPASVQVRKRGLGLRISREMQDRNNIGAVQRGLGQIRNAIVRSVDGALMNAITASVTQTVAATAGWGAASGTTIRKDIQTALLAFANLRTQGYEYVPDTILAGYQTVMNLKLSAEFLAPFIGDAASQSPLLTGLLPGNNQGNNPNGASGNDTIGVYAGTIFGMDILTSPALASNTTFLLQKNVVGGIADERGTPGSPIEISDPYPEQPYESTRWDVTRAAAGFIDNPLGIVEITGT